MTFRWSFVRSFVRRSTGENADGEGEEEDRHGDYGAEGQWWRRGRGGDRLFYGNILVGHTVCRRGRRSQRRSGSVEEEDDEEQGRSDQ